MKRPMAVTRLIAMMRAAQHRGHDMNAQPQQVLDFNRYPSIAGYKAAGTSKDAARRGVEAHIARMNCPNCNPTARAYARVQAQWVVAGIDKGE